MKKFLMMLAVIANFNVHAGMIDINVSSGTVVAGDSIVVDVLATNFEPLDTFSFRLDLDTSLFAYDMASLTSDLTLSNPFGFLEVNAFDGYIAFSFLDFDPILTPDFTLASFTLDALSVGMTQLSFSNAEFYQSGFTPVNIQSSNTTLVNITQVPEPSTWMFLPLMVAFLIRQTIKR